MHPAPLSSSKILHRKFGALNSLLIRELIKPKFVKDDCLQTSIWFFLRSYSASGRNTPPSRGESRENSRSREPRREDKPAAAAPPPDMSDEEVEKKTKAIMDEYLHIQDSKVWVKIWCLAMQGHDLALVNNLKFQWTGQTSWFVILVIVWAFYRSWLMVGIGYSIVKLILVKFVRHFQIYAWYPMWRTWSTRLCWEMRIWFLVADDDSSYPCLRMTCRQLIPRPECCTRNPVFFTQLKVCWDWIYRPLYGGRFAKPMLSCFVIKIFILSYIQLRASPSDLKVGLHRGSVSC